MFSIRCNSRVKSWRNKRYANNNKTENIYKYNGLGINFLSEKEDWKKIEKNNITIGLTVLYAKKRKNISCLCFKT